MLDAHTMPTRRSTTNRSRVTNGKLHNNVDGRSAIARRYRDLVGELQREHIGNRAPTTGETALIRQAAAIVLATEQQQAVLARGEVVDADNLIRLSSEARRVLASLRRCHGEHAGMKPRGPFADEVEDLASLGAT